MTDQHPLTDETCDGLVWFSLDGLTELSEYDYVIMRAATDWQLEQVLDWVSKFGWYLFEHPCQKHEFISELKKAMRPTQEDSD